MDRIQTPIKKRPYGAFNANSLSSDALNVKNSSGGARLDLAFSHLRL